MPGAYQDGHPATKGDIVRGNDVSWWDWPMAEVRDAVPMLSDGAIDDFIARFDPGPAK